MVGPVAVGGEAPITVQTMTNTSTADPVATIDQIRRCEDAGADLIRVSCPDEASTRAFLNKTLAPADYVQGVKLNFFDGDKEVGRLPIEIWDDNFTSTYKVPGYELEKGKVCS